VGSQSLACTEPDNQTVDKGNEPQQHVGQIHPYRVLHALLATLLRSRMVGNVDLAKEAEESSPKDAASKVSSQSKDWEAIVYATYNNTRSQAQNQ